MPIKVTCSCGSSFAARDELAGRTVACPKCKQPLTIAAPQQAAAPAPLHANAGLFDDIGLKARDTSMTRCPGCGVDMPPNAVLCVKCGFNVKLGRKMQTVSMSEGVGGGGHGAHGDVTAMIMAKAARATEEDEIAESTKTKEGMPAWALAVGLVACIIFAIVMSMIPQGTALGGTALLLIFAGYLLQFYAWIRVVIVAAKINPLYGVGVFFGDIAVSFALAGIAIAINWATESSFGDSVTLLRGCVWLTFAYVNSDECGPYIMFFWISVGMRFVGIVLLIIAGFILMAAGDEEEAAYLDPPLPPAQTSLAENTWSQPVLWKSNCVA